MIEFFKLGLSHVLALTSSSACLPLNILNQATSGPLAKRYSNGVSLTSRWWPDPVCWLGIDDANYNQTQRLAASFLFGIWDIIDPE